jgi:RimJ/RimL family protein N-acetyltransferase
VAIWDRVPPLEETVARIDAVTFGRCATMPVRSPPRAVRPWRFTGRWTGAPDLATASGSVWPPDARPKAAPPDRDRRLTLRLPRHADFRAWSALRRESRDFLTPWEPAWAADHLSRKAFTNRVYWAQRAISQGSAVPLFPSAGG